MDMNLVLSDSSNDEIYKGQDCDIGTWGYQHLLLLQGIQTQLMQIFIIDQNPKNK